MNLVRNSVHRFNLKSCHDLRIDILVVRGYGKKSAKREKPTLKALAHFDDLYGGLFRHKWPSIRLGLLSQKKHVVLLNNYTNTKETEFFLKCQGAMDLRLLLEPDENEVEKEPELVHDTTIKSKQNMASSHSDNFDKDIDETLEKNELEEFLSKESATVSSDYQHDSSVSLHKALSQSQIDENRLIDPSLGLDSTSLNEYVPVTEIRGEGPYVLETDYYRFYKVNSDIPVNIEPEHDIVVPDTLKVYSYPRGDVTTFPSPKVCSTGVHNYYPLDGASILVVLALGLQPGDKVLDMCAAPGGKSLTILQTLYPELLVCNDISLSRIKRVKNVFQQYLLDYPLKWDDRIKITTEAAEKYNLPGFNKILVDVPCTNDRKSAQVEENNIFKACRIKERLMLPVYQANILINALKLVSPGGTVVYSTCSLSPMQNDGVVNMALKELWNKYEMKFTIRDLNPGLSKISHFYKFATDVGLKYGSVVLPFVPVNFGPMYFCKIVKDG